MNIEPKPVHRRADLQRLLSPSSVAIVGASPTPNSFGERALRHLEGFAGRIHLVNAKYPRIGDRDCHPSLKALPEVPDCVLITVGRESVEAVVRECAALGVGGAVIFASGYAETGKPERAAQQETLGRIARDSGLRLIGPNCIGLINYLQQMCLSFNPPQVLRATTAHRIGLVSQSGALAFSLAQAAERGVCFSHVLSAGNSCDVDVADQVAFLAEEPECKAIACVFEGLADPIRLLEAARRATANGKPVVVFKLATGESGAAAAMSHTGSLAGSTATYRAAFEHAGVVWVDDVDALIDTTVFMAKAGTPGNGGLVVVATSGGAGVMAADKADLHGVALPQPSDATRAVLEQHIPDFGSSRNPCDLTAQVIANGQSLEACADALMAEPAFDVLLLPHVIAYDFATPRIRIAGQVARRHGKIACNVWVSEFMGGPGMLETETDPNVALFRSMDHCMAAIAAWKRRATYLALAAPGARSPVAQADRSSVTRELDGCTGTTVTEGPAKRMLAAYGIPMVQDALVQSAAEAVAAAGRCGYPVVLKVESVDIPHKTDAGVVRLNLRDAAAVETAFAHILQAAQRVQPSPRIAGVLVQPMAQPGLEILVGARRDPMFGPLVVVGLGGVMVELVKDTQLALAPVNHAQALHMLGQLRTRQALDGFRGLPPVDRDKLADAIVRISHFVHDQAEHVAELDVNPLICNADGVLAVDALIGLSPAAH
ncbi:acetate--CoA ligase family protein [Hydrogenophaga sp. BPS33]|uniref:acetate--CoA ligase family protein n=1 Tax=Hydrogenophaga sp. BPS33 TaxID=2651974 RepID=UPI00132042CB|nr:acetate--CoA ligase family protein [Hydrogenophaga sp. BPS33]QHE84188.1 acetate--CoA ligase family protein [Hydrogenophaga sp. BPS33]